MTNKRFYAIIKTMKGAVLMLNNYKPEGYTVKELIALLSKLDCPDYRVTIYGDFGYDYQSGKVVDLEPEYDIDHKRKIIELEVEI